MQLTIEDWRGWMPGIASQDQWQQWCASSIAPEDNRDIDVSAIPAMLRRRLSPMGRACASTLLPLLPENDATAIVFASQHGEVARTHCMLEDLAKGEPLSPTAFSLSVHNAIAGILSINKKITSNITAIAAGGNELLAALIEAGGLLNSGVYQQVLCVICDQPVPNNYQTYTQQPNQPFALAFRLSLRNKMPAHNYTRIALSPVSSENIKSVTTLDEAAHLQFIRLLCQQTTAIKLPFGDNVWQISHV